MRWLLTDDVPFLDTALECAGEQVVSGPEHHVAAHVEGDDAHPNDYPLRRFLDALRPDVVVLVDPWRPPFGYARAAVASWKGLRHTVVMLARDDPATWRAFTRGVRSCACTPRFASVYVTNDPSTHATVAAKMRAVMWAPGQPAAGLLAAVAHARAGQVYRPGRDVGW